MCGITGFIDAKWSLSREARASAIHRMASAIIHRGPESQGVWLHPSLPIALGHRRLAILELSEAGHQPFLSSSGNQILVFNGEIYNHLEVREELVSLGHTFRGRSDTEVMLAGFLQWGVEKAIERMAGMFAFAYVDVNAENIWLGRDRMGEKPLYYGWGNGSFLFGSELKALLAFPGFAPEINRDVLADYLRFSCVPAPDSIYRNVFKLSPGMLLKLPLSGDQEKAELKSYWSLRELSARAQSTGSEAENVRALDLLLRKVVGEQANADVPLGAFLSGGIDSSLIVALMQQQAKHPVKTFTIGFEESDFNEAGYAKDVAAHLGTDHTELYVGANDALRVIPRLPQIFDEPFADSSQIPTFLVAELARRQVTVSLSGDGGDEVFAGYNRHFIGASLWRKLKLIPRPLRSRLGEALAACPPNARKAAFSFLYRALPGATSPRQLSDKIDKLIICLRARDYSDMYYQLITQEAKPEGLLLSASASSQNLSPLNSKDPLFAMQMMDSIFYLPNDILTKVDRATMAVSLESRSPFLDHRVVEFAWGLPANQRVRNGKGKWALRQLLSQHIPNSLIDRPKSGFAIPIDSWLKGPLRPWAESQLDPRRISGEGYFRPEAVSALWRGYLEGRERSQYRIWNLLMFQAWLEANASARSTASFEARTSL